MAGHSRITHGAAGYWLALGFVSVLSACGGGGGSSSAPPPPPNTAPVASAGEPQTVDAGERVTLDASASSDSDGSIRSYLWVQNEGSEVELEDANRSIARFTAPFLPQSAELLFTLTVEDDDGARSSDLITITVRPGEQAPMVTISGRIDTATGQSLDGDTNDPFNPLFDNSSELTPQPISNPVTLGGYVNEPGSGAEGRSQIAGDREDYFIVDLLAGQSINLLVAEFRDADADLYLYTESGELVDFSIETGERETIPVALSGRYLVNVSVFSGATNYTLTIGSTLTPVNRHYREDVIPGQVVLAYGDEDASALDRAELARQMRLRELGGGPRRDRLLAMDTDTQEPAVLGSRLGPQRFRKAQFTDDSLARRWDTLMSIKRLAKSPGIRSAEPNYRVRPTAAVNDAAYAFQWHYPLINVPGAWDTSTGDPGVIVAVIDTGILGQHPDLTGQYVPGYDFIRDASEAADGDGIDPDPEETIGAGDPAAINFHGSHVAGTIAARGNNGIGVAGVAFGAKVMPLRAITASGGTTYDVNQAVRFAAGLANDSGTLPAAPADIINLSLAGGGFSNQSQSLYNSLRAAGIVVVASAGNEGSSAPSYPASYDNVISVSAVDAQQQITDYSNTGAQIDVAAPGGDGSDDLNGDGYPDGVLSTGASDGEFAYTFLSGTSMAAPHVAGVIALMKSVNPALTAGDIDRLLRDGALTDDLGPPGRDDRYGEGIINARKAIEAALAEAGAASESPPRLSSSTSALNFGSTATRFEVLLGNSGGGELRGVTVASATPWIEVESLAVDAQGLGRYAIGVDRRSLDPGIHEGSVVARSSANDLALRVIVAVSDAQPANLGQLYVLLYDPDADTVAAQAVIEPDGDGYRFRMPPVPAGDYQFFAGTDLDNDLIICDAGEGCGAYLTIDQPLTVTIDRDRSDIRFPVEYLIALPGAAASGSDGTIRTTLKLERQANKP